MFLLFVSVSVCVCVSAFVCVSVCGCETWHLMVVPECVMKLVWEVVVLTK